MDSKNVFKNILKFAAIALGVFILAQAVSSKSYSFSLSYSSGSYCEYCSTSYSYSDSYYEPSYYSSNYDYYGGSYYDPYYQPSYYYPSYSYYPTYTAVYSPANYSNAVVSYDYYRLPLTSYGTYYADSIGGYPYAAAYNVYSPYYNSYYSNYSTSTPYYYN